MSNFAVLGEFEEIINRGSMPSFILGLMIQKGAVGRQNQYKFVVNSDDHLPPHVHVSINNQQIAKYDLVTGEPISSTNSKLDKVFSDWYSDGVHRSKAINEWERAHGPIG